MQSQGLLDCEGGEAVTKEPSLKTLAVHVLCGHCQGVLVPTLDRRNIHLVQAGRCLQDDRNTRGVQDSALQEVEEGEGKRCGGMHARCGAGMGQGVEVIRK